MRFPLLAAGALLASSYLSGAALIDYRTESNYIRFRLTDGVAGIEWLNASTFRFCRAWSDAVCRPIHNKEKPIVRASDTGSMLELRSEYLVVSVDKQDLRLEVRKTDGTPLILESSAPVRTGNAIAVERKLGAGEMLWGLGGNPVNLDRRGSVVQTADSFLISSAGFGVFPAPKGTYRFDLGAAKPDRLRMEAPDSELFAYYFYYGPYIKDIYEVHMEVAPLEPGQASFALVPSPWLARFATPLPRDLDACGLMRALAATGVSAKMVPALSLAREITPRLAQLAAIVPIVFEAPPLLPPILEPVARFRRLWNGYFATYLQEARERGFPMVRPLAMQFPEDTTGGSISDEFMLGDEILIAPLCDAKVVRDVYLPRGIWTRIDTGEETRGRQTIRVKDGSLPPMFARNGTIIPLAAESGGRMELHYHPKLGAEFFLWEPDLEENSQFHAAPALDLLRLEIESKKDRTYEWIVHHWVRAGEVRQGDTVFRQVRDRAGLVPQTWYYDDSRRNLHICLDGLAGKDDIVNVKY